MGHRRLQVAAHPGGHDRRRRVRRAAAPRPPRPAGRTPASGSASSGATAITPARSRAPAAATASATAGSSPGRRRPCRRPRTGRPAPGPAAGGRPAAAARSSAVTSRARSTECTTSLQPATTAALLRLHLPDEVPDQVGQAGRAALLGLRRRVTGSVLADVAHAERPEMADVAGREGLGDRDQGDLGPVAAGGPAGGRDPRLDLFQAGRDLGPPSAVAVGHAEHDAGEPAGDAVPAVGVEVRRLGGAPRVRLDGPDARSDQLGDHPGPQVQRRPPGAAHRPGRPARRRPPGRPSPAAPRSSGRTPPGRRRPRPGPAGHRARTSPRPWRG